MEYNNPLISIIVPVYNSEKHLNKCIDSILAQTYNNLEVVFVDDGSQDNSYDILLEYQKSDKRVRVIKQNNAGAAAARNKGIDCAKGDFIGFVDSDDWIEPDMYEILLKNLIEQNCDASRILINRVNEYDELLSRTGIPQDCGELTVYDSDEAIYRYLFKGHSLGCHLYRSECWKGVRMPENMTEEDIAVVVPLYSKIRRVVRINQYKYNYLDNQESVTKQKYNQRKYNFLPEIERQIVEYPEYSEQLYDLLLNRLLSSLNSVLLSGDKTIIHSFENKIKEIMSKYFKMGKFKMFKQNSRAFLYLYFKCIYKFVLKIKFKFR